MSVIYLLLTISIVVAIIFFIAFIVSVKSGQYDDSYTPSVRMLFEDELVKDKPSEEKIEKPSLRDTEQTVETVLKTNRLSRYARNDKQKKIQLNKQV